MAQVSGIVDLRMHDFRVRSDLQNLSRESKLLAALVAAPAPAVLSADAHIHLADRHRPTGHPRAPTAHQVRFHVGPPHQSDGCIEAALHQHFGIGRQTSFGGFHFLRSSFSACFNWVSNASSRLKLPSQSSCTRSSQSVTTLSRSGTSLQGRNWATLRREISPADSSTFMCEEIVGCVSEKWPTKSDTDASPRARTTTIPRRVGSARAAKAWSSCFISNRLPSI